MRANAISSRNGTIRSLSSFMSIGSDRSISISSNRTNLKIDFSVKSSSRTKSGPWRIRIWRPPAGRNWLMKRRSGMRISTRRNEKRRPTISLAANVNPRNAATTSSKRGRRMNRWRHLSPVLNAGVGGNANNLWERLRQTSKQPLRNNL